VRTARKTKRQQTSRLTCASRAPVKALESRAERIATGFVTETKSNPRPEIKEGGQRQGGYVDDEETI